MRKKERILMVKTLMKLKNLLLKMIREVMITLAERVMLMTMENQKKEMRLRKISLNLSWRNQNPRNTSICLSRRKIIQ